MAMFFNDLSDLNLSYPAMTSSLFLHLNIQYHYSTLLASLKHFVSAADKVIKQDCKETCLTIANMPFYWLSYKLVNFEFGEITELDKCVSICKIPSVNNSTFLALKFSFLHLFTPKFILSLICLICNCLYLLLHKFRNLAF